MSFIRVCVYLVVTLFSTIISCQAQSAFGSPVLSPDDKVQLDSLNRQLSRSSEREPVEKIRYDLERLVRKYPDSADIQAVYLTAVIWHESFYSSILFSYEKYAPIIQAIKKDVPGNARLALLLSEAKFYAHDYESALSLANEAAKLNPNDPWADLDRSRIFMRTGQPKLAVAAAMNALTKAAGDEVAVQVAISRICANHGVEDQSDIDMLVRSVVAVDPKPDRLLAIVSFSLDFFRSEPGYMNVVEGILRHAQTVSADPDEFKFQWARMIMAQGRYQYGPTAFDQFEPSYAEVADRLLNEVENDPKIAERAWSLRFDLALSRGDRGRAKQMLADGSRQSISESLLARKLASIAYAENRFADVISLYRRYNITSDYLLYAASENMGDTEMMRIRLKRIIEVEPDNAGVLGEYANFLLYRSQNLESSIDYGERALKLKDSPGTRLTLAVAYALKAGRLLQNNQQLEAQASYRKAQQLGIEQTGVTDLCKAFDFCRTVVQAKEAFASSRLP